MKDNLFDKEITFLDVVKVLLLIVTAFSTWNVVDILTPDSSLAWVRKFAAVGVVEGAFVGFEMATARAKNPRQKRWATWGFFCSIAVIVVFAAMSGLLEFGGVDLLQQSAGVFMGMTLTVRDAATGLALVILVAWIGGLASIYRLYSLADPDKEAELERNQIDGEVATEANAARRLALQKVKPVVAAARAKAAVRDSYAGELNQDELDQLVADVDGALKGKYQSAEPIEVEPANPLVVKQADTELTQPGDSFREA